MVYHKCKNCTDYSRLSDWSLCQSCDDFLVKFKIYNEQTGNISDIDSYDIFKCDFDKRYAEIQKYIAFEINYACVHRKKIRNKNASEIVLEVSEKEYQSINMRNNLNIAVEGLKNNIDQYLKGNKKYD